MERDKLFEGIITVLNKTLEALYQSILESEIGNPKEYYRECFRLYNTYTTTLILLNGYKGKVHSSEIVEKLNIIVVTINEISKKFDNKETKKYEKISKFISDEIVEISKPVKGGSEKLYRKLRNIPEEIYEVSIMGSNEIRGADFVQSSKSKIVQLNNIKRDLNTADENYYNEIMIPMIQYMFHTDIPGLVKLVREGPESYIFENIDKNFKSQISYINDGPLKKLVDYCSKRSGHEFSVSTNTVDALMQIVKYIDYLDEKKFRETIKQEFQYYSKSPEILLEELSGSFQLLTDPKFDPLRRHRDKQNYKQMLYTLNEIPQELDRVKIPKIKPNISVKKLDKMLPKKKCKVIYQLAKYLTDYEVSLIPYYSKIEKSFNTKSDMLDKITSSMLDMTDPDNTKTCIKRSCLLCVMLVRSKMLPKCVKHLGVDANQKILEICNSISEKLLRMYPIELPEQWYDKKSGLKKSVIDSMLKNYIL
jgi:hypothetical protein